MIILNLPLPPSTNSLYRNPRASDGARHRIKTKRYRTWLSTAGNEILAHRASRGAQHIPGRIALTIVLSFHDLFNKDGSPSKVRQDATNRIKAIEDLIVEHRFVEDDSINDDVRIYRSWDIERGRVRVFVEPCNLFESKRAAE